jgi:hypothetical protein
MGRLLIHSSHGAEDPERATLPFVIANNAAIAGQEVVVMLTIEGVRVATKGARTPSDTRASRPWLRSSTITFRTGARSGRASPAPSRAGSRRPTSCPAPASPPRGSWSSTSRRAPRA